MTGCVFRLLSDTGEGIGLEESLVLTCVCAGVLKVSQTVRSLRFIAYLTLGLTLLCGR